MTIVYLKLSPPPPKKNKFYAPENDVQKVLVFVLRDPASFPSAIDDVPLVHALHRDGVKFEY